jgi:hypothetical protein
MTYVQETGLRIMRISLATGIAFLSVFLAFSFYVAFAEKEVASNYMENITALTNTTNVTTNASVVCVGFINAADLQNKTPDDLARLILTRAYNNSGTANDTSSAANNPKNIPIYMIQGPQGTGK